jgi:hypothetical protein
MAGRRLHRTNPPWKPDSFWLADDSSGIASTDRGAVYLIGPKLQKMMRFCQGAGNNVSRRCSYITGDFFHSVPPGADVYLLCGVIHDWDDDRAVTILKSCRRAMTENSRALLVDMIVPDTASMSFSELLDLNILVMNGGRERTKAEWVALLENADYKLTRIQRWLRRASLKPGRKPGRFKPGCQ